MKTCYFIMIWFSHDFTLKVANCGLKLYLLYRTVMTDGQKRKTPSALVKVDIIKLSQKQVKYGATLHF